MNTHPNAIEAYASGLSHLRAVYQQNRFQSFISSTSDMLTPVQSPDTLFPGLIRFPREIFTQLMITDLVFKNKPDLDISSDLLFELEDIQADGGIINFFTDESLLPSDIDCTAIGLAILVETGRGNLNTIHQVVEKIMDTVNEAGIIQVYFPPFGHRSYTDPIVCVNALYLIALLDREQEAKITEDYVFEHLHTGSYLEGTRYYPSPDIFLYFLSRLVDRFPYFRERFGDLLRQELERRIGKTRAPLDLAAQIIAAKAVGILNEIDAYELILSKNGCGGWPANAFFRFGTRVGFFGCSALTTAFALGALETRGLYEWALSYYDYSISNKALVWETTAQFDVYK
jgi:hypothetical protein